MTSLVNLAQSLASSLPSASTGAAASGQSSSKNEEPFAMSHILTNLLENMTMTSPLTSVATTPVPTTAASSTVTYDIWSVPPIPTPMQTPIGSSRDSYVSSNNNNQLKEDNSSGSPGTSSSVTSISCFRCEERSPTTRCLECNDLFCHECCHKPTSDCQLREHTLLPIHQISPIGARPSPNSLSSANSGPMNCISFNSGSVNSGSHNSGSLNSGSLNSGSLNSGSLNSGSLNSGSLNSGSLNSGSLNSGCLDSGALNSGALNSGSHNSGSLNSGSHNSGSLNSGSHNSGSFNSGSHNSGSLNSGGLNSSSLNSGSLNSGSFNCSSFNAATLNSLNSLNALNMLNLDKNDMLTCDLHSEFARFYCESCVLFICYECTQWLHKDHNFTPIRGALDVCRIGVFKAIEETKTGTKAIKTAIDRAVAMSKAYEKETAEANMKIRKAMRCYAQAVEDREKYLLDKVEKMRQSKMTELTDHMNTLRGILAGLAHTNETLVRSMDSEGIDLFMAKEKGRASVDYFSCMFKSMYVSEERIMFIPPNYDLVDQLKRQCDVQPAPASMHSLTSSSTLQSRQALLSLQSIQSAQSFPPLNYNGPSSNSLRSMADYSSGHTRSSNYYDHGVSSSVGMDSNPSRGIGQAIPGYWMSVSVRPARSPVPGVPMFSFGREGQDEGQVSRPWGLCVDREGNIIVADRRNNRIQIFNCRGEFKTMFGSKGTGAGEFDLPAGITTDTYGRIIVIDKDNHRVQIFTSSGNFILKFGSFGKECGQFQYPWDVAVNTVGNIVVTDTRNHRIQMFTSDGSYITKFVFEGANPAKMLKGPTTPRGVCYTTAGNIIVSDFENHRLLMVDPTLSKVLHCIGREGSGMGELNRPSGIVTDDDGRIIVADSKNHRVLVFTAELRILWAVDLKSPGLDDKDRPSDVALTTDGYLVVLFETLPDTARDISSHGKQYIKVY